MHNDLAWAVLGVEPTFGAMLEAAARQQGFATGKFLEQLMQGAQDAAGEKAAADNRHERLTDLISNMSESLIAAANVVKTAKSTSPRKAPAPAYLVPEAVKLELEDSIPERIQPELVSVKPEEPKPGPTSEQLQEWLRAQDESSVPKTPTKMFGRALLRRSS